MAAIRRSVIDPEEKTGENTNVGKQANARWEALPRGEKVLQMPGARTIASPREVRVCMVRTAITGKDLETGSP